MGFTIGGISGLSGIRSGTRPAAAARSECTAVAEYTGLWGWDVVAPAPPGRRGAACSCGAADCPAPGAHPLDASLGGARRCHPRRRQRSLGRVPGRRGACCRRGARST